MDRIKIIVDMNNGECRLFKEKKPTKIIADAEFVHEPTVIRITDFSVAKYYKRKGYGTILMHVMMGISRAMKKPIVLFSLLNAVPFYENIGFTHLRKFKKGSYKGVSLTIKNLNPNHPFNRQVGPEDFIWIPTNMKEASIHL